MKSKINKLLASCALLAVSSEMAYSQDAQSASSEENDSLVLEEIFVTASKRGAVSVLETPISISAIGGDTFENIGAESVSDALRFAPGLTLTDDGAGSSRPQVRGISGFFGDTLVAYYIDDFPYNSPGNGAVSIPDVGSFDLERVEVLKGPQGTLYGASALGGVIRVLTKDPQLNEFEVKGDATLGTIKDGAELWQVSTAVNVPLIDDKLALRVVVDYRDEGGWVDYSQLDEGFTQPGLVSSISDAEKDVNGLVQENYRAKLLFTPTDELTVRGSIWAQNLDSSAFAGFANADNINNSLDILPNTSTDFIIYNGTIEYETPWFTVYNATSFGDFEGDSLSSFPGFGSSESEFTDETFSNELRLNGDIGENVSWLLGGFYRDQEIVSSLLVDFNDTFNMLGFPDSTTDSTFTTESWALFGEVVLRFFDGKVELTGGARYYEDERTTESSGFSDFGGGLIFPQPDTFDLAKFDNFTPRINIAYLHDDTFSVYFNYTEGFRSGIVNGLRVVNGFAAEGINGFPFSVDSETLTAYELGLKKEFLDGKFGVEIALYLNRWKDFQAQVSTPTQATTGALNAGQVNGEGIDFYFYTSPLEGLRLTFGGNYNNTTATEDLVLENPAPLPPTPILLEGDPPSFGADFSFAATVDYVRPVFDDWQAIFHYDVQFTNEIFGFLPQGPGSRIVAESEELLLMNARIGLQNENYSIFFFVDNILDNNNIFQPQNPLGGFVDVGARSRPRVIGLNLKFNFN